MKFGNLMILAGAFFFVGSIVYRAIRQLATGKEFARGGRVIATRRTNPMLCWSSMLFEVLLAAGAVAMLALATYTLIDWRSLWH
jgi:hypothetical protein